MKTLTFRHSNRKISVGKIICLGRNYAEHAKEMNAETPKTPVLFLKPSTAIIFDGENVVIPPISKELHHEVEMVVVVGKEGKDIPKNRGMDYVVGYAIGLDMTLRDIQADAKKAGLPWCVAKGFDTSAPVSEVVEKSEVKDPHNLAITLRVNGKVRQQSNTNKMIFRIEDMVSYISTLFTLEPGDLIFTGTPEGVGQVVCGDVLEAELESVGKLTVGVS